MTRHHDLERTPLLDEAGIRMLLRLREHPHAPRWNYAVGDRLVAEDLPWIAAFREALFDAVGPVQDRAPPETVVRALEGLRDSVPWFVSHVPRWLDLRRAWQSIPTSCRRDLAVAPWEFVPREAELRRLVIYRTAGTTGHPIQIPQHPRAIACYQPLIDRALQAHGVTLSPAPDNVVCLLVGAQLKTYTYSTVLYASRGAGFAKVNLRPSEWPCPDSPARYIRDLEPQLVTGEPVAFSEMLARGMEHPARAMLSTSVAMAPTLSSRLARAFGCPIVDWYSLVETGPIAYSCPLGHGMHVLPHDLHVEIVDSDGAVMAPGRRGEVTVSGGRNPYLPLLRYRTGDFARMAFEPCPCGEVTPRLVDLEGRRPVLFRAADGTPIGSVDLSRRLREFPLLQHRFRQQADRSCTLWAIPLPGALPALARDLADALRDMFGGFPVEVHLVDSLGADDKVVAYESAFDPEGTP